MFHNQIAGIEYSGGAASAYARVLLCLGRGKKRSTFVRHRATTWGGAAKKRALCFCLLSMEGGAGFNRGGGNNNAADDRVFFAIHSGGEKIHKLKISSSSALRHLFGHVPLPFAGPAAFVWHDSVLDPSFTPSDYGMDAGDRHVHVVHVRPLSVWSDTELMRGSSPSPRDSLERQQHSDEALMRLAAPSFPSSSAASSAVPDPPPAVNERKAVPPLAVVTHVVVPSTSTPAASVPPVGVSARRRAVDQTPATGIHNSGATLDEVVPAVVHGATPADRSDRRDMAAAHLSRLHAIEAPLPHIRTVEGGPVASPRYSNSSAASTASSAAAGGDFRVIVTGGLTSTSVAAEPNPTHSTTQINRKVRDAATTPTVPSVTVAEWEDRVRSLEIRLNAAVEENDRLHPRCVQALADNERLRGELQAAEAARLHQAAELSESRGLLQQQSEQSSTAQKALRESIVDLRTSFAQEKAALETRCSALIDKNRELEFRLLEATVELSRAASSSNSSNSLAPFDAESTSAHRRHPHQDTTHHVQELHKLRERVREMEDAPAQRDRLQALLHDQAVEMLQLKSEISSLKAFQDGQALELDGIVQERRQLLHQIAEHKEEVESLTAQNIALIEESSMSAQNAIRAQSEINLLRDRISDQERQTQSLKVQVAAHRSSAAVNEERLADVQDDGDKLRAAMDRETSARRDAENQLSDARQLAERVAQEHEEEVSKVRRELSKWQKTAESLNGTVQALRQEVLGAQQTADERHHELVACQAAMTRMELDAQSADTAWAKRVDSIQTHHNVEIRELENAIMECNLALVEKQRLHDMSMRREALSKAREAYLRSGGGGHPAAAEGFSQQQQPPSQGDYQHPRGAAAAAATLPPPPSRQEFIREFVQQAEKSASSSSQQQQQQPPPPPLRPYQPSPASRGVFLPQQQQQPSSAPAAAMVSAPPTTGSTLGYAANHTNSRSPAPSHPPHPQFSASSRSVSADTAVSQSTYGGATPPAQPSGYGGFHAAATAPAANSSLPPPGPSYAPPSNPAAAPTTPASARPSLARSASPSAYAPPSAGSGVGTAVRRAEPVNGGPSPSVPSLTSRATLMTGASSRP